MARRNTPPPNSIDTGKSQYATYDLEDEKAVHVQLFKDTNKAVDLYFGGAPYARDRDVVLVDTRGTGLSQPRLGCPEFDRALESKSP